MCRKNAVIRSPGYLCFELDGCKTGRYAPLETVANNPNKQNSSRVHAKYDCCIYHIIFTAYCHVYHNAVQNA